VANTAAVLVDKVGRDDRVDTLDAPHETAQITTLARTREVVIWLTDLA
jgi:hypothetical protein